jgi:predicted porin
MRAGILSFLLLFLPVKSWATFGLHIGSHLSYGRIGNESGTISERSMSAFDIQAMPGYRIGNFMPGLLIDYRFLAQLGRNDEYENTDYGGRSLILGLGTTAEFDAIKILFSYDFRARHNSATPDSLYKGSGFHFTLGYFFMPKLSIDFAYSKSTYSKVETDGVESMVSDDRLKNWNFGLGISYSY